MASCCTHLTSSLPLLAFGLWRGVCGLALLSYPRWLSLLSCDVPCFGLVVQIVSYSRSLSTLLPKLCL